MPAVLDRPTAQAEPPSSPRVLRLRRLHAGQRRVVDEARRFNVAACGRRWGKTILGENRAARVMLKDGLSAGWFAPTYKQLSEAWRQITDDLAPVTVKRSEQEHRLVTLGGGVLDCWSLDEPDPARGRKYALVVVDEAAHVRDLERAWSAVIRPTLVDYHGGAWFVSTPNGLNYYYTLYQRGLDPEEAEWAAWQLPTTDNPYIDPAEVEAARGDMAERTFAQEHLAQFLTDDGAVFRGVTAAATATPQAKAVERHQYVMGLDWGRTEDFTVAVVLDVTTRELVALDRFNQIDWTIQYGRVKALYDRFRPALIVAEHNSIGSPAASALRQLGLPLWDFTTTNATKAAAIEALALAIERRDVALLDDPVLLGELQAYAAERLPSGLLRYGAPVGLHDDCVMALAMGWQGARADTRPATSRPYTIAAGPDPTAREHAASDQLWTDLTGQRPNPHPPRARRW